MSDRVFPVLIVEDDLDVARTICSWVDIALPTACCVMAGTLAEALELLRTFQPPFVAIVMDLTLPDTPMIDAPFGAVRVLHEAIHTLYEQHHQVKKIIFTGGLSREEAQQSVKKYDATYLCKPKDFKVLMTALKDCCSDNTETT